MSTHNIGFLCKFEKSYHQISSNTHLISCAVHCLQSGLTITGYHIADLHLCIHMMTGFLTMRLIVQELDSETSFCHNDIVLFAHK